jgi:hypothetical protein
MCERKRVILIIQSILKWRELDNEVVGVGPTFLGHVTFLTRRCGYWNRLYSTSLLHSDIKCEFLCYS